MDPRLRGDDEGGRGQRTDERGNAHMAADAYELDAETEEWLESIRQ